MGAAAGGAPRQDSRHSAGGASRALALLALALLPALAAAQQRAVHPIGAKYSIGTLDIAVLHAPEACRVQAFPGDTVPTPAKKQSHKTIVSKQNAENRWVLCDRIHCSEQVVVDYVGTFSSSGREFDSSKKHKSGFSFELGAPKNGNFVLEMMNFGYYKC